MVGSATRRALAGRLNNKRKRETDHSNVVFREDIAFFLDDIAASTVTRTYA